MAVLMITGCGQELVTAPQDEGTSPVLLEAAAQGAPWVTRVTGGGGAHFPTGVIQNLRAQVTEWANGSVTGIFSAHGRVAPGQNTLPFDFDWEFDMTVDCLATNGEQAWMAGTVTRVKKLNVPGPFPVFLGAPLMFVVKDRHADPALPPGFFGPPAAFGTADCNDMPPTPPIAPGAKITGGFTIHTK